MAHNTRLKEAYDIIETRIRLMKDLITLYVIVGNYKVDGILLVSGKQ